MTTATQINQCAARAAEYDRLAAEAIASAERYDAMLASGNLADQERWRRIAAGYREMARLYAANAAAEWAKIDQITESK